jgi:hypothetical protein
MAQIKRKWQLCKCNFQHSGALKTDVFLWNNDACAIAFSESIVSDVFNYESNSNLFSISLGASRNALL